MICVIQVFPNLTGFFDLLDQSVTGRYMLSNSSLLVGFFILFVFISFCFMYFDAMLLDAYNSRMVKTP